MTTLFDVKTIDEVFKCLNRGDDINEVVDKRTPLYFACKENLTDVVDCLLKNGANPDPTDIINSNIFMYSPICIAAEYGYLEIIKKLLDAGYELGKTYGNNDPLYIAAVNGWMDIVDYLGSLSSQRNLDKALYGACKKMQIDIVDKLISLNANVNFLDNNGYTPLIISSKNGPIGLIDKLIINGANIEAMTLSGKNSLMMACEYGHLNIVKRFLELNCNIDSIDNEGNTPLIYACKNGHFEIAEILIKENCNVKCENSSGHDALHYTKNKRNLDISKMIVSKYRRRRSSRRSRKTS